jgi:hypothetical protein
LTRLALKIQNHELQDQTSFADPDPGSGAFLNSGSGIRDGKKSGSGSRMNNLDHISELKNNFLVEILKFFDAAPGSGMEKICIRDPGWKKFV